MNKAQYDETVKKIENFKKDFPDIYQHLKDGIDEIEDWLIFQRILEMSRKRVKIHLSD